MRQHDYNSADRKADRAVLYGVVLIGSLALAAITLMFSLIGGVS